MNAATQCEKIYYDKGTNTHFKKTKLYQSPKSCTWEEEVIDVLSSPSMRNFSSETDSEEIPVTEFNFRNKFLAIINKKPNMYMGLLQQYEWLLNHIAEKSKIKTSVLCLIITLFKMTLLTEFVINLK